MSEEVEINDPEAVLAALERAKADAKALRARVKEMEASVAELDQSRAQATGLRNTILSVLVITRLETDYVLLRHRCLRRLRTVSWF